MLQRPNAASAPAIVKTDGSKYVVSLYTDRLATAGDMKPIIAKLDAAFCNQFSTDRDRAAFFGLLMQRMIENGFTLQRATDAVNYVIDHCRTYKQINIADVIQFDRTAECLTYNEMCRRANEGTFAKYERFTTSDGKVLYKPKNDNK